MQYVVFIIISLLFLFSFYFLNKNKPLKFSFYLIAIAYRMIAAIGLFYIYSSYYQDTKESDIYRFYNTGEEIQEIAKNHPKEYLELFFGINNHPETFNNIIEDYSFKSIVKGNHVSLILINSLISFISFDSILVHFLIYNILAFLGLYWIHFFFSKYNNKNNKLFYILIFFLPSLIFWSAGPLKETLLIFFTGLILRLSIFESFNYKKILNLFLILISIFILFKIRSFYILIFTSFYAAYIFNKFTNDKRPLLSYFVLIFLAAAIILESDKIFDKSIIEILKNKHDNFIELAEESNSSSLLENPRLENNTLSFIKALPNAAINIFFRPFPNNIKSPLHFLLMLENIFLLGFLILIIFKSNLSLKNPNLFYFCLISSISLLFAYGLIVPVLGALARYKSIPVLFFLLAIAQLNNKDLKIFSNE